MLKAFIILAVTLLAANASVKVIQCTFENEVLINIGEGTGSATQVTQITSNLFVNGATGVRQDGNFVSVHDF